MLTRRHLIGAAALPWLHGCTTPLPLGRAPAGSPSAALRLLQSAQAHGLAAFRTMSDINVSYDGKWRRLIDQIQPEVVDAGFRGSSQERLMPARGVVAQAYTGPRGRKHVLWRRGAGATGSDAHVAVWLNGVPSLDRSALDAASLVAEGYGLFLLGPLWLVDRELPVRSAGTEQVNGRLCEVLDLWVSPGLGRSPVDRLAICIDSVDAVARRVRFTLEGFAGTQGAVAEVDFFEHERRFGVLWPTRFHERVRHPVALPAHDWQLTGLDVNRGYAAEDLQGPVFSGLAAAPAAAL